MKQKRSFDILYEDKDILVVNKPSGLLMIATDKDDRHNLYHYVREYLNKKRQRVFIVHRLDRDTSGVVIFAKDFKVKEELQQCFFEESVKRHYEAIVTENIPLGKTFHVSQYLYYDERSGLVFPTKDRNKGKLAITDIKCVGHTKAGSILDIGIKTGRQNQIRIALKTLGYTLIGDKKYAKSSYARMLLNAYELIFPDYVRLREHHFMMKPLWVEKKDSSKKQQLNEEE